VQSEREGHWDHDDLVAITDEVGIDRESLKHATAELAQTRGSKLPRQDEAKEIVEKRTVQLKRFGATLLSARTSKILPILQLIADRHTQPGVFPC
jgi:hypothetical protein